MLKRMHGVKQAPTVARKKKARETRVPWKAIRSVPTAAGDVVLSRLEESGRWVCVAEVRLMPQYLELPIGELQNVDNAPSAHRGGDMEAAFLCRIRGLRASLVMVTSDLDVVYEALGRVVPDAAMELHKKVTENDGVALESIVGIKSRDELKDIVLQIAKKIWEQGDPATRNMSVDITPPCACGT